MPEEEFSPAEVQSFLLGHKGSPTDAVDGVQEWVANQTEVKEPKPELDRESSWVKDE